MIIHLRKIAMVKYGVLKVLCVKWVIKVFMYYSCRMLWNLDIKRERFSILLIIYILKYVKAHENIQALYYKKI